MLWWHWPLLVSGAIQGEVEAALVQAGGSAEHSQLRHPRPRRWLVLEPVGMEHGLEEGGRRVLGPSITGVRTARPGGHGAIGVQCVGVFWDGGVPAGECGP